MSEKAERPLKDAIQARSLAAPKKLDPEGPQDGHEGKVPSKFPAANAVNDERPLFKGQEGQFPEPVPGGERREQREAAGAARGRVPERIPEGERRGQGDLQGDHSTPDQASKLSSTEV